MEKIAIIGASGFGREVKMLIDQINTENNQFEIIGYYDDNIPKNSNINGIKVLGKISDLNNIKKKLNIALGIGDPITKNKIISKINNKNILYPILIHKSVILDKFDLNIGKGTIICAGNILTCNIKIGDFVTLNLGCTVGHDTILDDFSSFMPSVNISGEVKINKNVYIGTGATIINRIEIGKNTIVGAGAVVSKNLPDNCTAVGIPAKPIKFHN